MNVLERERKKKKIDTVNDEENRVERIYPQMVQFFGERFSLFRFGFFGLAETGWPHIVCVCVFECVKMNRMEVIFTAGAASVYTRTGYYTLHMHKPNIFQIIDHAHAIYLPSTFIVRS